MSSIPARSHNLLINLNEKKIQCIRILKDNLSLENEIWVNG
jgi:hypothetical protein